MAQQENDLIILGGGCAGLSLAGRLAVQSPKLRFTVVEPRAGYEYDRTWCGWRTAEHPFEDAVISTHAQWRVVTPSGAAQQSSANYPFEVVSSEHFYQQALAQIAANPNAQRMMGAEANFVTESDTKAVVRLKDGTVLRADCVVDTRPQRRTLAAPWLWQNFVGYIVKLAHPQHGGFDDVPVLMDFQPAGAAVAQFVQVLPIGQGCYLCKWVQLSHAMAQDEELDADLMRWLTQRAGQGWQRLHREKGSLPLAPPTLATPSRVVTAGIRGGSLRLATGYAFHSIQEWAEACASSLASKKGRPVAPQPAPMLAAAEKLLLAAMQKPGSAGPIYGKMFAKCPADALVRFFSGIATVGDAFALAGGMPLAGMAASLPLLLSK